MVQRHSDGRGRAFRLVVPIGTSFWSVPTLGVLMRRTMDVHDLVNAAQIESMPCLGAGRRSPLTRDGDVGSSPVLTSAGQSWLWRCPDTPRGHSETLP